MTTSWKKFLEEQNQNAVKILSNSPVQTLNANKIPTLQQQNVPQGTISAATPEQERDLKIGSIKKTISDKLAYPKALLNNGVEWLKQLPSAILGTAERTLWELATEGAFRFIYQKTKDIDEERAKNYSKVFEQEKQIKSFAKPILEKNEETVWLIDEAKTGKTNIFAEGYKNAAEYWAGSSINVVFPDQWVDVKEDTVYFANSKTTVSKPVLKNSLAFWTSKLLDVYNSITYNFQQNWDVYSVEDVKAYVPEWKDVPDAVIQQFVYDALSDVQEWKRRDIDLYAEYYPALSNWDKYISQKDSLLQLLTDENFINRWLADYLELQTDEGETLEPRKLINCRVGSEDLKNLLDAAMTIKAGATILNESGANITQATDYAIAKSYADQYPKVKEALETFDRLDLSIEDFDKIVANYKENIGSINREYQSYGWDNEMSMAQLEEKVDKILWDDMREFNEEYLNTWNKERLQWKYWYAGAWKIDSYILWLADAYRADDGKWYDKDWNEVEQTEVRRGITGKYLNLLMDAWETMSTLWHEWDILDEDPTRESVVNVISDNVNLYFDLWNFTKGWFSFNLKTQIPFVWPIYEKLIGWVNEVSWELILWLANMTLFADGAWSEESQQKFKQAAGWLVSIQVLGAIERAKWHIKAELKKDYYQSAFKKALDSYTTELTKGLLVIDIEAEKAKITKQNQPEQVEGENQKEVDKIEKDRKVQRIVFMRWVLDRALSSFNKTFEEELQKNAGEWYKPSIIDYLWNLAGRLANRKEWKTTDEILDEWIKKIDEQRAENEKQIEELEKRKNELESKERTEEENKELDSLNEKIAELRKMTDELTGKRNTTEETQSEEYREVKAELDQKRTDLETTKQQREELKSQLDDINNQIINARGEWNTELVKELTEQKKDTKKQIEDIDKEIKNLERDIRTLEWNWTIRDMLEDIKHGARESYQETKEWLKGRKEDITTPETPEVEVEETKAWTPEIAEWVAKTETKAPEETKTTVAKILDIIQKLQDNARWLYDKLTKPSEDKKIRQREIERLERADELINRMWDEWKLDKWTLDKLEDNPFTDEIMRIVDRQTDVETDKKGRPKNVTPKKDEKFERDLSKDDVEREVLSSWLTRMQQYVDNVKALLKRIWEVYDKLSKEKNIDSIDFIKWDILRNLLDKYNLRIDIEENEDGTQKAKVSKKDNVDTTAVEEGIVKYVEDFINKTLRFEMKSEADVQADRTKLTWNEDTYWKYDDWFENEFRKAFNDFLDTKADQTELLRKLDEQFSNLKENLEAFDDFMNKKWELKNSAKNKILKLGKEDLAQLEQILPGITKLVELTKISYDLVSKVKKAKMQYKDSNLLRGHWVRYMWVMAASNVAGYLSFWLLWIPLASLAFVALERLWTAGKRKVSPKELDRSTYSKYVDLLKVDWNEKAEYKQWELERLKKESEILKWKKEAEVQQTLNDAMEILIKRKANDLIQQKAREAERERRVKEREDRMKLEEWNNSQQPIDNALPGVKPDVVTPEWEITLGRWNPISPAPTKTNRAKPITEVKETYKDKEKTQKGYSEAENKIIETALWLEEKEYSKDSEELANVIEESVDATSRIMKKDAINKLEEKGEDVTPENIAKEVQKEPSSIEEFIMEAEKWAPEETTNYDGADIKDLEEVVANPKKYPNVDIEAAKAALEKARRQNMQAEIMQSPDQQQAQKEIAWIYKGNQMEREWNKGREKQREDMVRETNRDFDTLETTEEYDRIESQITPEKWEQAKKYAKWYKGFYRADKAKTDELRADMWKDPSQNIQYTNRSDKIATITKAETRKSKAQKRITDIVDPAIAKAKTDKTRKQWEDEKTALTQIIEQANVEIQAKEELKAQKTELANEYKRITERMKETPYKENKQKLQKQREEISDEFDKLTYEEQGQFAKPKEVEAEEIKEAEKIEEERQNLDMNETPQIDEIPQEVSPEKVVEWKKETKTDKLSREERKQLNQINKEIEDSIFYKWGTDARWSMTDREKIEFTNTLEPHEEFYHASDTNIKEWTFDLSKTKDDPNGLWLAVSTSKDNPYGGKKHQYTINWKNMLIAKEWTTTSESNIRDISEILQIEPNAMWQYVPLAELTSIIRWEVEAKFGEANNADILKAFRDVTKYDWVDTSHGYTLLWNVDKINGNAKKNKWWEEPEKPTTPKWPDKPKTPEPTTPKTPEPKNTPGSEPLVKIESDMSIYKEPIVWDFKTKEIFDRMEYIKNQAKEKWKLYAKEATELKFLQDLYKRQIEWEWREKQWDITDEDYVKAYETWWWGVDKAPF